MIFSRPWKILTAKRLESVLEKANEVLNTPIKEAACDRGDRGKQKVGEVDIVLPKPTLKKDNRYQRVKKRKKCRQRAGIEPLIGHLKSGNRLGVKSGLEDSDPANNSFSGPTN